MKNWSCFSHRLVAAAAVAACFAFTPTSARSANAFQAETYRNETGGQLPYRLLSPERQEPGKKYPLVVFFHGAGERGTDNQNQLKYMDRLWLSPKARQEYPCFVMAPQCPNEKQWVDMPWGTDSGVRPPQPSVSMTLALEILDSLPAKYPVDTNRIYVMGLSMGGYATWDCVTRFPEKFAAGAPICGGGDEKTVTPAVAKVPVWAFHSEDDGVVKVRRTRNMIQAMRDQGGHPQYFEYFFLGHGCWDQAMGEPELLPWLFSQKRGQTDTFKLKTPQPELPAVAKWPASDDLFPGKGALQKADWFKKLYAERRLHFWQTRERDHGAVVFLGDSITQGWGSLRNDFAGIKVANRGISGDTTRQVRYRLKEDVLDLEPAAVVLLIGTNDLGLGGEPESAFENTKEILAALKKANPKMPVIISRVMPRAKDFDERVQKLNALVDEYIKNDPQFVSCDTWSLFLDPSGGAIKAEFPDLLHPNAAGYTKWTAALKPMLAKLGLAPK
jgi:lysophospholipase L1-like esterase/poly(3-hydroxybutyrate) depolymerase